MENKILQEIAAFSARWAGQEPLKIQPLPPTASNRFYFRVIWSDRVAIAVFNDNVEENKAFLYLSDHFIKKALPVPAVYACSDDKRLYLQEDLGDHTLFDVISASRQVDESDDGFWLESYGLVIKDLIKFQLLGDEGLDYSICYPSARFSDREIHWDLNYFKHYFLKLAGIPFHEGRLQDGFDDLVQFLIQAQGEGFMYRDFQARNIMVTDQGYFYIDFQGGRRGPLHYDVASLLFNSKADIPLVIRESLLTEYINGIEKYLQIDRTRFRKEYYAFALLRVLQAMGAYGYRGYFERKHYFLTGIPFGQQNLNWLLNNTDLPVSGEFKRVLERVASSDKLAGLATPALKVEIRSFSYKRGIPVDRSGHGGGFVFDCRCLPNPGRDPVYQHLTGRDKEVIQYLEETSGPQDFLQHVFGITSLAIQNYLDRGFTHLSFNFGCTGGRHRSVYCAEKTALYLTNKFRIELDLAHLELDGLP